MSGQLHTLLASSTAYATATSGIGKLLPAHACHLTSTSQESHAAGEFFFAAGEFHLPPSQKQPLQLAAARASRAAVMH